MLILFDVILKHYIVIQAWLAILMSKCFSVYQIKLDNKDHYLYWNK
jgi:hypothetical protein